MDETYLYKLAAELASLQTEQACIKADVAEIKQDVKKLAGVPAARWTKAVETVIVAAVGALLALLLK